METHAIHLLRLTVLPPGSGCLPLNYALGLACPTLGTVPLWVSSTYEGAR
jgi:hypothetical protein